LGAFEISFNNKIIFSKLKCRNWPNSGQIVELVEKEISRIENCIPDQDKLSQSFIRKRATNSTEEISTRPKSSQDKGKKQKGSSKLLRNN